MKQQISAFARGLTQARRRMGKVWAALEETESSLLAGMPDTAFCKALVLAEESEKLTLLTRTLPAHTGHPLAHSLVSDLVGSAIPIKMGFTSEGWYYLSIPALLPKKEKGSPAYIRSFLYPAMRNFFHEKKPVQFSRCVLIFRHIYRRDRPERQYRDHDNIELNMVADVVALYVMQDDGPMRCAHYYTSAVGDEDKTEVFVVPQTEFIRWLEWDNARLGEEVIVYETRP